MTGTATEAPSEGAMELTLAELKNALRSYLAGDGTLTEVRAIAEGRAAGFDRDRWSAISSTMGVGALMVGQAHGGLGLDLGYACAAVEMAGQRLCPAPVRSTLVAASAIGDAVDASPDPDTHPAARWLDDIASHSGSAALATDPDPLTRSKVVIIEAGDLQSGDGCTVSGTLAMVEAGADADHLLVWADTDEGTGGSDAGALVGISVADATGLTRTALSGTDPAGGFARIELNNCPAVILGGRTDYEHAVLVALVLRAAEQVGLARGALAMATEHARQREQFGRIIGSYQAISHRLAQTAVDIEGAAGLVTMASNAVIGATPADHGDALAPLAAASAARVSTAAADTLIQVLGGIGFTWEHNAQFWFRRIKSLSVWMGSADALDDLAARRHCHRALHA